MVEGVSFANLHVANAGIDRQATENTIVTFTGTVTDPNPANGANFTRAWSVLNAAGATVATGSGVSFDFRPQDEGVFRVLFTVTDLDDASRVYQDIVYLIVTNVAPSFAAATNATVAEGSTFTRSVSFTDPGADLWIATIDYGDGSALVSLNGLNPSTPLPLAHLYPVDGIYTVTITMNDGDGGIGTQSFVLTVTNVAPTVSGGADRTIGEGTPVTLVAVITDPGANDPLTIRWTVVASNGQVIAQGIGDSFTFTPLDNGTYTLTVTATDEDAAVGTDQVVIAVTNVRPTLTLTGPSTIDEGTLYRLVLGPSSDSGTDSVTQYRISWGDGSPVEVFTVPGEVAHLFVNQGSPTINVTLVDEDGTHVDVASKTLTVRNVAAVLTGITTNVITVFENGLVTLTGTLSDPGAQDVHTVKILWGDGTTEQNVTLVAGAREFTASHQYPDDKPTGTAADVYSITARISDGTVDSDTRSVNVTVANVAPAFGSLTLSSVTLTEGTSLAINGSVTDPGGLDVHSVSVDWGDGSPVQNLSLSPGKIFAGNHVYAIPGRYNVATTASDDDGGMVISVRVVTVEDLPPVIAPLNSGSVAAGAVFTKAGSFTDLTGPEDSWTATAAYDNGPLLPLPLATNKTFNLQHVFANAGTHSVTVVITDNFGRSDTKTFAVEVANVSPAPVVLVTQLNGGTPQRSRFVGLTVQFSQNVGASLSVADIRLRNLTTSADVPASSLVLSFNSGTNTLTIGAANGVVLAVGNYQFTLLARGVTNGSAQVLTTDVALNFFVLPGDANGDRVVNDRDLLQVWQSSLSALGQQNLNNDLTGDGRVTTVDVSLVRSNYLAKLPSERVEILAAAVNTGDEQRSRLVDLTFVFNENVGASVTLADVGLRNLTTFTDVTSGSLTLRYDYTANTLTIGLASGVLLPDGDYRMTLRAAGIMDGGGRALDAGVELNFHILTGDTNGDRILNEPDLFLVWRNLLQPPANRDLQFDLNNDRAVSVADVDVIRASYQNGLNDSVPPGVAAAGAGEVHGDNGVATNVIVPTADFNDATAALGSASGEAGSQIAVLVPSPLPLAKVAAQKPAQFHPVQIGAGPGFALSHASMVVNLGGRFASLHSQWSDSGQSKSRRDCFNLFNRNSDDLHWKTHVSVRVTLLSPHALDGALAILDLSKEGSLSTGEEFELPSNSPA